MQIINNLHMTSRWNWNWKEGAQLINFKEKGNNLYIYIKPVYNIVIKPDSVMQYCWRQ